MLFVGSSARVVAVQKIHWRELAVVALAVSLAWGLRGQHGHEKGAAIAGAMAGLSLAATTGGARWIGAAVIGSLAFAIGGSLSYGKFVHAAYEGSLEAMITLALIGFVWGGLGALGLGLGLALPRYRFWERVLIAGGLLFVWFIVDRLLWGRLSGPGDLGTRELMAFVLLVAWGLVAAYVGAWRRDSTSLKLAVAGGVGFGIGFPVAAWVQGIGAATGIAVDWWKIGEHFIGLIGGTAIGWVALGSEPSWRLPLAVRPWERWLAVTWLLWFLPTWLMANNLDFWVSERALFPLWFETAAWSMLLLLLLGLALWGWMEIRRGRTFVTSWMPRHLRRFFLLFVWLTTLIACGKTVLAGIWTPTPLVFFLLAGFLTLLVRNRAIQL